MFPVFKVRELDFMKIESSGKKMRARLQAAEPVAREFMTPPHAVRFSKAQGRTWKLPPCLWLALLRLGQPLHQGRSWAPGRLRNVCLPTRLTRAFLLLWILSSLHVSLLEGTVLMSGDKPQHTPWSFQL